MGTFLFDRVIFGPVWSRRLGESLGINLLPVGQKYCNFNCIYCECGLTPRDLKSEIMPDILTVKQLLDEKLQQLKNEEAYLNAITFAGNGEPTLHPKFPEIMDETIESRNRLFPSAQIAVLSNATTIGNERIFQALLKADLSILKLDSAIESTLRQINCPGKSFSLAHTVEALKFFKDRLIIQTLFLKGQYQGKPVDNTTPLEIEAWLSVLKTLQPKNIMIYSLARDTAVQGLEKIGEEEINQIADKARQLGLNVQVTP
jgi:wyosine [tRNA(Phe)-imidazoG37] synthetase (radical SAM superfamily)